MCIKLWEYESDLEEKRNKCSNSCKVIVEKFNDACKKVENTENFDYKLRDLDVLKNDTMFRLRMNIEVICDSAYKDMMLKFVANGSFTEEQENELKEKFEAIKVFHIDTLNIIYDICEKNVESQVMYKLYREMYIRNNKIFSLIYKEATIGTNNLSEVIEKFKRVDFMMRECYFIIKDAED